MSEGTVNHQAPCPMIEALGATRLNFLSLYIAVILDRNCQHAIERLFGPFPPKTKGVLLQLYLAPFAPLLRMSDVGLVRVGKVRIHVAIVATAEVDPGNRTKR